MKNTMNNRNKNLKNLSKEINLKYVNVGKHVKDLNDSDDSLESVDLNVTTSESETIVNESAHEKDASGLGDETSANNSSNNLLVLDLENIKISNNNLTADDEEEEDKRQLIDAENLRNKNELTDAFMLHEIPMPVSPNKKHLLQANNSGTCLNDNLEFKNANSISNLTIKSNVNSQKQSIVSSLSFENFTSFEEVDAELSGSHYRNSVFNDLLFEIYDRWHYTGKDSFDSDTFTDMTESDVFISKNDNEKINDDKVRLNIATLTSKNLHQLRHLLNELNHCSNQMSGRLIKQLKTRERYMISLRDKYDIMTAILHASSLKRREDSKIRFSIEPLPGVDAFNQWKDAMKAVARLPLGIPNEFRRKVWLSLADNYISSLSVDWEKTKKFAFNERSNPDDSKLGLQIVKDLHRTGCSGFSGRDNDEDRAVLKRVLLAYARWNKNVGYCQGFNILAALILEVVHRQEDAALKVMIYLIDKVLPESYFANNLRSLSVDMAVFRDLLRTHLPELSRHLDSLQSKATNDLLAGASYEPPLTNVFTMQWFLTMFATCLPKQKLLRVWDCVLLDGSEVLLRTGIVIWEQLQSRILNISSVVEFYTIMGQLSQKMMEDQMFDTDELVKKIFSIAPFPLPQLAELREKFTYNITPFMVSANKFAANRAANAMAKSNSTQKVQSSYNKFESMLTADDDDNDDLMDNINCFTGIFPLHNSGSNKSKDDLDQGTVDISKLSPGAYTAHPELNHPEGPPVLSERVTLDVDMLKRQYKKLMQRQKRAHIILSAVQNKKISQDQVRCPVDRDDFSNQNSIETVPAAINHLFASRDLLLLTSKSNKKNLTVLPVSNALQAKLNFRSNRKQRVSTTSSDVSNSSNKDVTNVPKDATEATSLNKNREKTIKIDEPNNVNSKHNIHIDDCTLSLRSSSSSSLPIEQDYAPSVNSINSLSSNKPSQPWIESLNHLNNATADNNLIKDLMTDESSLNENEHFETVKGKHDAQNEDGDDDDGSSQSMVERLNDNRSLQNKSFSSNVTLDSCINKYKSNDDDNNKKMSFKEFIESLPDETNAEKKFNSYSKKLSDNKNSHGHNVGASCLNVVDVKEVNKSKSRPISNICIYNSSSNFNLHTNNFNEDPSQNQNVGKHKNIPKFSDENICDSNNNKYSTKTFNPFPRKVNNTKKTKVGIQLGLYLSQNYNKIDGGWKRERLFKINPTTDNNINNFNNNNCNNIITNNYNLNMKPMDINDNRNVVYSKSYHTACLHRQYIMNVNRKSKNL